MSDTSWLTQAAEKARRKADEAAAFEKARGTKHDERLQQFKKYFPSLWAEFGTIVRQRASVYNRARGAEMISIEHPSDQTLVVMGKDGLGSCRCTIVVNPQEASIGTQLSTSLLHAGSSSSGGGPRIGIALDEAGATFTSDGIKVETESAADAVLRPAVDYLTVK